MDIPRNKKYPLGVVQCDGCGGNGCEHCQNNGWVLVSDPMARRCARPGCGLFILPDNVSVYCQNACAVEDA